MPQKGFPTPAPSTVRAVPLTLRVVVVGGASETCQSCHEALVTLGHHVLTEKADRPIVELCRLQRPDLVIVEAGRGELSDLDAAEAWRDWPVPFVILHEPDDPVALTCSDEGPVFSCVAKPVRLYSLAAAITAAVHCFGRVRQLSAEVADLRQALEDRKIIERAKGIVMTYANLGEEEAFARLRKLASHQNQKLIEIAQAVIAAGNIFQQLEQAAGPVPPVNGHARYRRTERHE